MIEAGFTHQMEDASIADINIIFKIQNRKC